MSALVRERLAGCNADSLDSYLRGLGLFLLAGELEPGVRAWWDEDAVLWLATPEGVESLVDELVGAVLDPARSLPRPIRTPWRGRRKVALSFAELRNQTDDAELDWVDACALPRSTAPTGRERSDHENNPLLGQGGAFGSAEVADAHAKAIGVLRKFEQKQALLRAALFAVLRRDSIDSKVARQVSVTNAVLGAYQSGRATGPGLSADDVKPTSQKIRTSAWDVVLVLEGLRAFRGAPTRRPEPGAIQQASFPLLVRARAVGLSRPDEFRDDDEGTFELLAPLWSAPCGARALRHVLAVARLRAPHGVARDTLDAALVQAGRAVHGLGFDRLVRFAFVASSDPRYRYAVRRGALRARGAAAARRAVAEIVPFLRRLDCVVHETPPALALARRRLEDELAGLAAGAPPTTPEARRREARRVQDSLVALALLETPAARAPRLRGAPRLEAPRLSRAWLRLANDGSAEYRLARAVAGAYVASSASVLREHFLPQRIEENRFVLDATAATVDLERVSDPLRGLVEAILRALRVSDHLADARSGSGGAQLSDLALLLSGELGRQVERRLALLTAAFSGIEAPSVEPARQAPSTAGASALGADVARLLLAAAPVDAAETPDAVAERGASLAALVLAGNIGPARVATERQLRRRELDLLPAPPIASPAPASFVRLALALLVPPNPASRDALQSAVTRTPSLVPQGGLP